MEHENKPSESINAIKSVGEPKQKNFLISLLSILLLISVLIAGIFAYQTQKFVKELQSIRNERLTISTPVATQTSDPTTDWETYTGQNFLFKYPTGLSLEKTENKIIVRIDAPDIKAVEGICPRYLAFSIKDKDSVIKTVKNKYSCVHETLIKNENIFIESQYYDGQDDINKAILSTFKFTESVACTMDAKICPDGSAVGRSGPKCEFAPCPTPKS